jgi:hypothetical protein
MKSNTTGATIVEQNCSGVFSGYRLLTLSFSFGHYIVLNVLFGIFRLFFILHLYVLIYIHHIRKWSDYSSVCMCKYIFTIDVSGLTIILYVCDFRKNKMPFFPA